MIVQHLPYLSSKRIVLASQSPRRREILDLLGLKHEVVVSGFEENLDKSTFSHPSEYVLENARCKAEEVAKRFIGSDAPPDLVIGSDTVVILDNKILEKPLSEAEAFSMLKSLSNRNHTVLTSVALFLKDARTCTASFYEATNVSFAELNDNLIWEYIRTREPMDKAGAYGIQGIGGSLVKGVEGCYFNVMGFPMHRFATELARLIDQGAV
ncbi:hypothetical protein NDN08_007419 [Rhodosorus marinus]|uniref:Septum formation protein Maf n=1 Tax=Rhodosorus marinus TaxID=101924 RepID=A0AAV8UXH8_9RHOD|nr:hypothetical protein NDN08_007419 [Rhodosorus marinus]